jgi:AraC-like DNA-binding protein
MLPDPGIDRMPARQWSTDAVDPARRLDYWVGAICEAFLEMDCGSREAGAFEGRLTSLAGPALSYNQVVATTQDVYRTPAAIARGRSHPFYLITQLRAPWHVRQGGELLQLRPGDAVLVDSAQRYELHFPQAVACLSIQMPRAWVGRWLAEVDTPHARPVAREQGWGRALSALCLQLGEEPALAACYPQDLLDDQVGAMLAAALEPGAAATTPAAGQAALARRAERLLLQCLDQPGLTAAQVARELGVSARSLHRAFACADTTFAGRLRRMRMERAAQLLGERRLAGVTVAEVGRRCGYPDASHFAREFGKAWGQGPARWRRARLAG